MPNERALRVVDTRRRGSSWPFLVETGSGRFFTKLRGAGHGLSALVAEVIVGGLAELVGLRVPARALITIDEQVVCDDRDAELADLLRASRGLNLGFAWLEGARDFRPEDGGRVSVDEASQIVWLDGLVANPDRTARNPNLLWWRDQLWLIDHGSTLVFHHDWSAVTEDSPRRPLPALAAHVLADRAKRLADWDTILAEALDRDAIRAAVAAVPADFLAGLVTRPESVDRRREAYLAFLWKRLRAPRPFV